MPLSQMSGRFSLRQTKRLFSRRCPQLKRAFLFCRHTLTDRSRSADGLSPPLGSDPAPHRFRIPTVSFHRRAPSCIGRSSYVVGFIDLHRNHRSLRKVFGFRCVLIERIDFISFASPKLDLLLDSAFNNVAIMERCRWPVACRWSSMTT